jgi:hypothetical protein
MNAKWFPEGAVMSASEGFNTLEAFYTITGKKGVL